MRVLVTGGAGFIGSHTADALVEGGHEVVVLDDHSEDATAERVLELARKDGRVRLVTGPPLPAGWCGKQHACWVLAREARHPLPTAPRRR